jgi:hypothetical protein
MSEPLAGLAPTTGVLNNAAMILSTERNPITPWRRY